MVVYFGPAPDDLDGEQVLDSVYDCAYLAALLELSLGSDAEMITTKCSHMFDSIQSDDRGAATKEAARTAIEDALAGRSPGRRKGT
jgi:hypothetical protein